MKKTRIIQIDRSGPFEPMKFMDEGTIWTIAEEDEQSLALTEINLNKINLKNCLKKPLFKKPETWITCREWIKRLKEMDCIRLDAKVLQTLLENQNLIPESWKEENRRIIFDGTIVRIIGNHQFVLGLRWVINWWQKEHISLGHPRGKAFPSAILTR